MQIVRVRVRVRVRSVCQLIFSLFFLLSAESVALPPGFREGGTPRDPGTSPQMLVIDASANPLVDLPTERKFSSIEEFISFAKKNLLATELKDKSGRVVGVSGVVVTKGTILTKDRSTGRYYDVADSVRAVLGGISGTLAIGGTKYVVSNPQTLALLPVDSVTPNMVCLNCPEDPPGGLPGPPQYKEVCNTSRTNCIEGESYESIIPPIIGIYHAKGASTRQNDGCCVGNTLILNVNLYARQQGTNATVRAYHGIYSCQSCGTVDFKLWQVSFLITVGGGPLPISVTGLPATLGIDDVIGICSTHSDLSKGTTTAWGTYRSNCY